MGSCEYIAFTDIKSEPNPSIYEGLNLLDRSYEVDALVRCSIARRMRLLNSLAFGV